jgi:hypothetical protein
VVFLFVALGINITIITESFTKNKKIDSKIEIHKNEKTNFYNCFNY